MVLNLISFFGGFLFSSIIDTSLGEFNEWAIVGAALVVATIESFNKIYFFKGMYVKKSTFQVLRQRSELLNYVNTFKIGILYGLIVDGFKLGS